MLAATTLFGKEQQTDAHRHTAVAGPSVVRVVAHVPTPHHEQEAFFVVANGRGRLFWILCCGISDGSHTGSIRRKLEAFRKGDTTIPLVNILESFDVYQTQSGGASGLNLRANKQHWSNAFNMDNIEDVIMYILQNGQVQPMPTDKHKINKAPQYRQKDDA
ncbi:hypothetical protein HDU96_006153 [Phlyctochytrium bullatum]|nr:hypothetical protein HDU96_006153 [Phlyctochytrium bullatum]